jgi:4-carboxymuconolactone decarboxylase
MKLLAIVVTGFYLLASAAAFAQTAGPLAADVRQTASLQVSQTIKVTRNGSRPSAKVPGEHFTGSVRIDPLFDENPPAHTSAGRVTFEAGARTAWHSHPLGQSLIVTAGTGRVRQWGGQVEEMRQGDVVWIPPGVKHWHGATTSASMTHIAIQESLNGKTVEWMEKVGDEEYRNSQSISRGVMGNTKEPSAAQKLFGDFDPKLAEITDNVLFGDVWERPGLSKRDRSLITVAA